MFLCSWLFDCSSRYRWIILHVVDSCEFCVLFSMIVAPTQDMCMIYTYYCFTEIWFLFFLNRKNYHKWILTIYYFLKLPINLYLIFKNYCKCPSIIYIFVKIFINFYFIILYPQTIICRQLILTSMCFCTRIQLK